MEKQNEEKSPKSNWSQ